VRARLTIALALVGLASCIAAPASSANSFFVTCTSSHVSHDDPIVYPGQAGAAHRHEFFGASNTDANSTTDTLSAAPTTCSHRRDTAAYWVPTLEVRSTRVTGTMRAYYQRAGKRRAAAPPRGLRILAGDPHAMEPQPSTVTTWTCVGRGRTAQFTALPRCVRGEQLGAWVKFPDCWNGRTLDSTDHRSHLAYAVRGRCPTTHPVEIMRLALLVTWPVRPARASDVRLAGDHLDPTGMHGDFFNAWHMPTLRQLRWDCIEVATPCGALRG
jgi:hypothetical protein